MKILVSIISEHLIPNYHLYQHFKNEIDRNIFISSKKMEKAGYSENLKTLVSPDIKTDIIILNNGNDFESISNDLNSSDIFTPDNEYIVNITGGTKLISLAVFNHFKTLNSEFYYVAIGTNSCQKFHPKQEQPIRFKHKISLSEYMRLYGYYIETDNSLQKDEAQTKRLFNSVKQKNFNSLSVAPVRDAFTDSFALTAPSEKEYYTGGWFEEYLFITVKQLLNLEDSQIGLNVKVKRNPTRPNNDNEFDIMFVNNNRLYVIECKSSIGKKKEHKKNLESFLYKLAAEIKDMGLQVTPMLAVTAKAEVHPSIRNRAELLNIHLLGAEKLDNNQLFNTYIKLL